MSDRSSWISTSHRRGDGTAVRFRRMVLQDGDIVKVFAVPARQGEDHSSGRGPRRPRGQT